MGKKQKAKNSRGLFNTVVSALVIFVFTAAGLFYWHFSLTAPNLPVPPLKDLAATHNVALGSLGSQKRLKDKPYKDILASQYSFITIDGEAHWIPLRPSPTQYNFTKSDKLVAFAEAHNMPVQLHHLVWGEANSLPNWLKKGNYSKDQLLNIIHDDITNVVGHYKGQVNEWSVVNEAFTRAQHIYGLSDWWADHMSGYTSYIDDSFIWAHQADPNAKLILNDFYNESQTSVSDAEYNYIKAARNRGVPINGIGMQLHIDASRPPNQQAVIKNMQRFGAISVPTYVTEFDVNVNLVKGSSEYKRQLESQITADMVRACIESQSCVSFNVFGMTEKDSFLKWLGDTNSRSYLFTSRYHPNPSFYAFRQAWQQQ